ncbi:MAG: hypothetical protein II999_04905 [Bacteroidaceae bacterium]|nr:hypothetical protein [Bacteroidaceae bacterium]
MIPYHSPSALSAPLIPLEDTEKGRREREEKKEGKKDEKRREEEKTRKDRTGIAWPGATQKKFPAPDISETGNSL